MSEYVILTLGLAVIGVLELAIILLIRKGSKGNDTHLDEALDRSVDRIRKRMDREVAPPGIPGPVTPGDVEAWVRSIAKGG